MAFCPNCGAQASGRFCPNCGTAFSGAPSGPSPANFEAAGLTDNVASALCYLFGFITGIIFLLVGPYNRNRTIRFHAFQSIFTFAALVVIEIVLDIALFSALHLWILGGAFFTLFRVLCLVLWIYLMYNAYNGRKLKLPFVGDLAEKQA